MRALAPRSPQDPDDGGSNDQHGNRHGESEQIEFDRVPRRQSPARFLQPRPVVSTQQGSVRCRMAVLPDEQRPPDQPDRGRNRPEAQKTKSPAHGPPWTAKNRYERVVDIGAPRDGPCQPIALARASLSILPIAQSFTSSRTITSSLSTSPMTARSFNLVMDRLTVSIVRPRWSAISLRFM